VPQGAYSTRMGAALRHASQLLSGRQADKKLLLVLTDGQPADVDVADPEHLIADAAQAVREAGPAGPVHPLHQPGCPGRCLCRGRIFGGRWTVVDRVAQLPRRLPEIFLALTK
jgi:nitric oxide reductase NorD protein